MSAHVEYPKWLWDLIIRLQKHEDEHAAGPDGRCLGPVLAVIPSEIRDQAQAIASYARAATTDAVMQRAAGGWDPFGFGQPSPVADCAACEHGRDRHREGQYDCEYEPEGEGRCDCAAFRPEGTVRS